jgi:hypothetical protein
MLWMVFGSTADFSGGGVMVAGVLSFLNGPSGVPPCCFRFCFDLAISLRLDVKSFKSEEAEKRRNNKFPVDGGAMALLQKTGLRH